MKAIRFKGNKKLEVIELPKPVPEKGQVIIKVLVSGICRTDIDMLYEKTEPADFIGGHEVAGIIDDANYSMIFKKGDRVILNCHWTCGVCKHCKKGDLIFCPDLKALGFEFNGGYAEYLAAPESILRRLPDDISFESGIIAADALGTAFHGAKKAGINKNSSVGIIGLGPVGLMAVVSAKYLGGKVFAIDVISERRDMAKTLGADALINPQIINLEDYVKKATGGDGLDIIIDCSGSSEAINNGLKVLKTRGKCILIGVCTRLVTNAYDMISAKEVELIGSRNYHDSELGEIFNLIRKNRNIEKIITNRFKIDDAVEAFKLAEERKGLKIIITGN